MRNLLAIALGALAGLTAFALLAARTPASPKPDPTAPGPAAHAMQTGAARKPAAILPARILDLLPAPVAGAVTPEQVLYAQPTLLRQAIARLRPQRPDKVDLYLVTFAGDGGEDVFRNEAEYAARLFAQRFNARGHTLVLENNPATVGTTPLATWSNLEIALAALHRIMDPQQDILLLYVTTHGSEDHTLLVDLGDLPLDPINSDDLASILDEHPFRWKVVVLNACYSGGFIPPLRDAGTLVLTAARADRSSFGCGSESAITYFGDAWLAEALNRDSSLIDAFARARKTIAGWEARDHLTHSQPQIYAGKGIADQLARWRKGFTPGPALAFQPPPRRSTQAKH